MKEEEKEKNKTFFFFKDLDLKHGRISHYGYFFCLREFFCLTFFVFIWSTVKRTRDKCLFYIPGGWGLTLATARGQFSHSFSTGRYSVDSPFGCIVKQKITDVLYSTFELICLRNCFMFQLSLNRFTVVCLYNVTFLYFYVWEK